MMRPRVFLVSGFTLVELMVALAVMALIALLSWRGLDGMVRVQAEMRERTEGVASLLTGLAQWSDDLDALVETGQIASLDFDGSLLRMTRRDTAADDAPVRVVGWVRLPPGQQGGPSNWARWQSPPVRNREQLQTAWSQVQRWAQSGGVAESQRGVAIVGLLQWQIFYYRNDAWSNPQSSAAPGAETGSAVVSGGPAVPAFAPLPDGVRLVLTLPPDQPISGVITKDWVRPVHGGGK